MLFVIGDSHVMALREGFQRLSPAEQDKALAEFGGVKFAMLETSVALRRRFFRVRDGRVLLKGRAGERFDKLVDGDGAVFEKRDDRFFAFSIGFQIGNAIAEAWETYTIDPRIDDKSFISRAALREIVRSTNAYPMRFYRRLKQLGVNFVVLAAPPPPRSIAAAANDRRTAASEYLAFVQNATAIFAEDLSQAGIGVVDPPEAVAQDGFLREELRANLRHNDDHGNAAYGEIFLRHLFQIPDLREIAVTARAPAASPRI